MQKEWDNLSSSCGATWEYIDLLPEGHEKCREYELWREGRVSAAQSMPAGTGRLGCCRIAPSRLTSPSCPVLCCMCTCENRDSTKCRSRVPRQSREWTAEGFSAWYATQLSRKSWPEWCLQMHVIFPRSCDQSVRTSVHICSFHGSSSKSFSLLKGRLRTQWRARGW